ncbi:DUF1707 domain-containing protein [Actinoplanes sp. N902-109]|uniref:DUF1707 SHOCT-like domain-containing protein n=1 Tax=Actinoplanes sp. (strain N902-109) TaxID=649831 RepID=UPI00032965C4|nr:DUF1707 domain-containing protein [Actinoplanes sp. N902-109]AGL14458.1 hypothetical protein L083_0948 [Actinoplanes sp. N902-109]
MGRDEMRAGNADREAVADQLRAALEEGRLELDEYDDRVRQAYAAKTYGELSPLLRDLPAAAPPAPRPVVAAPEVPSRELALRWLGEVWASWVAVVGMTSAIWAVTCLAGGDLQYFWPFWVAVPWGAVLVWVSLMGLATGEPRKQADKKVRKAERKQLKAAQREKNVR